MDDEIGVGKHSCDPFLMTIARQFILFLSIAFLLIIGFAVRLTYQFGHLSAEGAKLIDNLQKSALLNRELAMGNGEQSDQLRQQFESLDPGFPEILRKNNYELGEKYTQYLKLDIGEEERLTVEKIKARQSDLSIMSMQIFEQLREGTSTPAGLRLRLQRHNAVEREIRDAFEKLNDIQLVKLRTVVDHLNSSAAQGLIAVFVLVGGMVLFIVFAAVIIRRRILRPMRTILQASERIRSGDFSVRAPVASRDEFGQLTQGFNFMAESLAESYAGLENKVEERTRQVKEMQDQLVRAEKMSAVGQLVSGVAHELNNPLAAIMGFAELARMELAPVDRSGKGTRLLEDIDLQVERCRRIVANLLQFARQQEPHLEAVEINKLVEQVLQLRMYEFETRNVGLVRDLDPSNPVACVDPGKMQQLILNLLNNAHDAIMDTGRPGTIWLRTRAVGSDILIEVLDDGTGFLDVQRAFDPFYTTKEVGKGTGLGLSLCYGIVKEHRGEIRAENWEKGARVAITIPVGNPDAARAKRAVRASGPKDGRARLACRALVVDDEEMLLQLQIAYLSKMGIEATGVSSGDEGLRFLEDNSVEIVISDVRMPGAVDGVQLYQWVRKNQPKLMRRFLFVSGDLVGMQVGDFFTANPVPRIEKPFRFADYSDAVRQVLNREDH